MRILLKIADVVVNTSFWKWIIKLSPRMYGCPKYPIQNYYLLRDLIRQNPNEIYCFVGADNSAFSLKIQRAIFNSYWGHTGFVELKDGELYISHIRASGFKQWPLIQYLKEVDEFEIFKVPLTQTEISEVNRRIDIIKNSKVHYELSDNMHLREQYKPGYFDQPNPSFTLYCSEYQYCVLRDVCKLPQFKAGVKLFSPDDMIEGLLPVIDEI